MKFITAAFAALLLALLSLSIPAPIFSTDASASRMNGKGSGCSDGNNCMAARHRAATARAAKKPKTPK
jgi:hypothetical protein